MNAMHHLFVNYVKDLQISTEIQRMQNKHKIDKPSPMFSSIVYFAIALLYPFTIAQ